MNDHSSSLIEDNSRLPVLLLRLNRPTRRNALTNQLVIDLAAAIKSADADADVRAIVLTGDEKAFCAGADIHEMNSRGFDAIIDQNRARAWRTLEGAETPIIAAVNGVAFGAGNELCMLADIVVAGSDARFGQPEVKIGGMAGDGGSQRLPRRIGYAAAMKLLLTGEPISASEAHRLGYAAEVTEPKKTVIRALEIAATIAANAPLSVLATKRCVQETAQRSLEDGLRFEREALYRVFNSEDRVEGMQAFSEKREPRYRGR